MTVAERPKAPADDAGFSRKTGVALAIAAALSFAIAMVVMAYGPDPARSGSISADSFSSSALGHRLLAEFLEHDGLDVSVQRSSYLTGARPGSAIVVAEPTDKDDFGSYLVDLNREAAFDETPIVLVAPKWRADSAQTGNKKWVREVRARPLFEIERVLQAVGGEHVRREASGGKPAQLACSIRGGGSVKVELIDPQYVEPWPGTEPIAWTDEGALIVRQAGTPREATTYFVSDPDLLNNHGLPRADNVLLVHALFKDILEAREVVFDEVVHGYARPQSFLAELLRFPLVVAILHGLMVLGLAVWAGSVRFGKPRPAPSRMAFGQEGLIDNTAKLLAYGGRVRAGALRYLDETIAAVADHYHLSRDQTRDVLAGRLEAISARRGVPIDLGRIRQELSDLDDNRHDAATQAVRHTTTLHRWREEMTDGS